MMLEFSYVAPSSVLWSQYPIFVNFTAFNNTNQKTVLT